MECPSPPFRSARLFSPRVTSLSSRCGSDRKLRGRFVNLHGVHPRKDPSLRVILNPLKVIMSSMSRSVKYCQLYTNQTTDELAVPAYRGVGSQLIPEPSTVALLDQLTNPAAREKIVSSLPSCRSRGVYPRTQSGQELLLTALV